MLRDQHGDGSRSPPSSHNSPPSCQTTWSSSPVFYFLSSFSLPIILPSPFSEKTPISWWSVVFMYFLLIEFWLALLESIYLLNPLFIPDTFKKMEQARCCRHYLSHPPTQPFLPANPWACLSFECARLGSDHLSFWLQSQHSHSALWSLLLKAGVDSSALGNTIYSYTRVWVFLERFLVLLWSFCNIYVRYSLSDKKKILINIKSKRPQARGADFYFKVKKRFFNKRESQEVLWGLGGEEMHRVMER